MKSVYAPTDYLPGHFVERDCIMLFLRYNKIRSLRIAIVSDGYDKDLCNAVC